MTSGPFSLRPLFLSSPPAASSALGTPASTRSPFLPPASDDVCPPVYLSVMIACNFVRAPSLGSLIRVSLSPPRLLFPPFIAVDVLVGLNASNDSQRVASGCSPNFTLVCECPSPPLTFVGPLIVFSHRCTHTLQLLSKLTQIGECFAPRS